MLHLLVFLISMHTKILTNLSYYLRAELRYGMMQNFTFPTFVKVAKVKKIQNRTDRRRQPTSVAFSSCLLALRLHSEPFMVTRQVACTNWSQSASNQDIILTNKMSKWLYEYDIHEKTKKTYGKYANFRISQRQ